MNVVGSLMNVMVVPPVSVRTALGPEAVSAGNVVPKPDNVMLSLEDQPEIVVCPPAPVNVENAKTSAPLLALTTKEPVPPNIVEFPVEPTIVELPEPPTKSRFPRDELTKKFADPADNVDDPSNKLIVSEPVPLPKMLEVPPSAYTFAPPPLKVRLAAPAPNPTTALAP